MLNHARYEREIARLAARAACIFAAAEASTYYSCSLVCTRAAGVRTFKKRVLACTASTSLATAWLLWPASSRAPEPGRAQYHLVFRWYAVPASTVGEALYTTRSRELNRNDTRQRAPGASRTPGLCAAAQRACGVCRATVPPALHTPQSIMSGTD